MGAGRRIEHATVPVVTGPSGLPIRHLITAADGATNLFIGQQTLAPSQRVVPHTHPVEEALVFLSGTGAATVDKETVPVGAGISLHIPPGVVHGFTATGDAPLDLLVIFPTPHFAETTLVEPSLTPEG